MSSYDGTLNYFGNWELFYRKLHATQDQGGKAKSEDNQQKSTSLHSDPSPPKLLIQKKCTNNQIQKTKANMDAFEADPSGTYGRHHGMWARIGNKASLRVAYKYKLVGGYPDGVGSRNMAIAFVVATVAPKTEQRNRDGKRKVGTKTDARVARRGFSRSRARGRRGAKTASIGVFELNPCAFGAPLNATRSVRV